MKKRIQKFKRKLKTAPLSSYVAFSFSMLIVFTVVMIVLFCLYQSVPDVLVTCYFSAFGGEVLMAALIKVMKLKGDNGNGMDN